MSFEQNFFKSMLFIFTTSRLKKRGEHINEAIFENASTNYD